MTTEAEALTVLRELVERDTTSGRLEAQAEAQEVAAAYALAVPEVRIAARSKDGRPWMLLETGSDAGVMFVCHVDTVPTGDNAQWSRDPFSAEVADGDLHGRGTVDMKGGLVAALHALRHAAGIGASASVLMTSDEEIGCRGAAESAESLMMSPRLVIVPEATNNTVSLGHRGATWLRLTSHGRAAHGSAPHRGVNAIRLLSSRAIAELDSLPLAQEDYLGEETVNLGTIAGGTATNIVPDSANLTLDVRTVRGGSAAIGWAKGLDPRIDVDVELDLPAVRTESVPTELSDWELAPAATYFTDASALAGVLGDAPVVIWGPGDPKQMHAVDEHLDLESWSRALSDYVSVVSR